jgi:signal transduction histidine kinase
MMEELPELRNCISRSVPYGVATAAVASALGLRMLLHPQLGDNRPFLTFLAAVALSAWFGGRGPAIFAIVLSYVVANWFLIPPEGALNFDYMSVSDWTNAVTFAGLALIIVEPILAMQRAQHRAEAGAAHVLQLLSEAKEAQDQKDRFLATLSHELRNPLAALTSGLQYWSIREHDTAELEDLRALMTRQVRRMSRLIDDLLDVARIARGRIALQKEHVEIAMLIGHAIESVRPTVDGRGHQLHVDLPAEPVLVEGDVVRLTQVFVNILDNAIKYTPRDGAIWIVARRQGDEAVVRIRDNGPGLPATMLPTVFEMFSQAASTLDQAAGGLGIGLALVKQLVTLHGGLVEARSEGPGTGAEFVVTLPACPREQVALPATSAGRRLVAS